MTKPANPHDRTFKRIMKNLTIARDFFEQHLPDAIKAIVNLKTLAFTSENFVQDNLKESIADIIYTVNFGQYPGYFYCQVEHKAHREDLCLWAVRKKIDIIQRHCEIHNTKRYPLVYVIALYHAPTAYNYPLDIRDATNSPQAINGDYLLKPLQLIDLNFLSDEELWQHEWAGIFQSVQKHINDKDFVVFFKQVVPLIRSLIQQDSILGMWAFEALVYYINSRRTEAEQEALVKIVTRELSEITGEVMQTIAEKLREEGKVIGLEQGLEQGAQETRQQLARRLLAEEEFSIEKISDLTDLSIEIIHHLQKTTKIVA